MAQKPERNAKLSIPLPFEDAIRAALKVKPEAPKPKSAKAGKTPRPKQRRGTAP